MKRPSQNGVALVITLIMLSVVTFMAVAFLALSRRERASVSVTGDQTIASLMSDSALARVQGQIISRMMARSNAFEYDFMVSTGYTRQFGFTPNLLHPTNVNYYGNSGGFLPPALLQQNIRNLQYDAIPPVFVEVTNNPAVPWEFRNYVDLNRNGRFDPSGWQPVYDNNGVALRTNGVVVSNFFMGDPEWVGVLERPEHAHSGTNLFVGRYAYMVVPEGKTLDLNYIHNQAKRLGPNAEGFYRNQGVGPWEINLAAFLRDLNTNQWTSYSYQTNPALSSLVPPRGAFTNALELLRLRYNGSYNNLRSISALYGQNGSYAMVNDLIDGYSDGPAQTGVPKLDLDNDNPDQPWPGSDNPRGYFNLFTEVFNTNVLSTNLMMKFQGVDNIYTTNSTYDRYTFYRLLAQLDASRPRTVSNRIHLNFRNDGLFRSTNFVPWTAQAFFTNAADRLLRTQFPQWNFGLTNIPLWPTNLYSSAVHRLLQLSANIYDATTNNNLTAAPHFPSVFRPVFRKDGNNIFIAGYTNVNNLAFLGRPWRDLSVPADRDALAPEDNVYGVPLVIGAKKGFPNFNEFALQTSVQVSRKLELRKLPGNRFPSFTNQLFVFSISNRFGAEYWNSYTQAYPRALRLDVTNLFSVTLNNDQGFTQTVGRVMGVRTPITLNSWIGNEFRVPLNTNVVFMSNAAYYSDIRRFLPTSNNPRFENVRGFPIPQWTLVISNKLVGMLLDTSVSPNRIVDFVNLNNLNTALDITSLIVGPQNIVGETSDPGSFWLTNRLAQTLDSVTEGVRNQIIESLGQGSASDSIWLDYNADPSTGATRSKAIAMFRVFCGLSSLDPQYPDYQMQQELGNSLSRQAPYTPTRKIYQNITWQVNDPLVHYTWEDLYDAEQTNNIQYAHPPHQVPTNSNLGMINRRYRPWGGNPNISSDTNAFNLALKDSMIRQSDDWLFPSNVFPNIGWLGRVHRGTPWQTFYLKSPVIETNAWQLWSVNPFTHPTNDWRMLELFTTAINDNAMRGLLSVNQTNLAAWSAVLSGVMVLSNAPTAVSPTNLEVRVIQPAAVEPQLRRIVESINTTRAQMPMSAFGHMGDVLASPALTVQSPYLDLTQTNITDEVYERIPQQILSLLKEDEPRLVVYTFGQSLAPAPRSLVVAPGTPYHRLCTNYQITSEVFTKNVLRLEPWPTRTNLSRANIVQEQFQFLSNE